MLKVVVIGLGNVGTHISRSFQASKEVQVIQYFNRSKLPEKELEKRIGLNEIEKFTCHWDKLKEADFYLIAVKDDAINATIEAIPFQNKIVAHTSGSVDLSEHKLHKNAVFYPLQTFSKDREVSMREVPICLEAFSEETYKQVEKIGASISNKIFKINSLQRRQLHLSAVFVCNFVNHLYHVGNTLCLEHQIDPSILEALIQETAEKINLLSPKDAQTGPALRNDIKTIQKHIKMLEEKPQFKAIYQLLSSSIATINHTK